MHLIAPFIALMAIISPTRTWYPPTMPLTVNVKSEGDARLVLTDFAGKEVASKSPADFKGEKSIDLKGLWPELAKPGTFILYAVGKDKPLAQFEGTPWVIEVRADHDQMGGVSPEVTHVVPLEYAVMTTDQGPITMVFYYDSAPLTVESFLNLSRTGYYDKLGFHRIVPGFVIQGGDPKGDGTGGPGYHVEQEFNDRPHLEGVLSMARAGDPNSAGSQFFICLDYENTQQLDKKYTGFGRVVDGMNAVNKIAGAPLKDVGPQGGAPQTPQLIQKVEVKPVTSAENPYAEMMHSKDAK